MVKILLISFSDNADHQDALFGLYEALEGMLDTYLMAIEKPKVALRESSHTWLVNCPKRPGITKKTFDLKTLFSIIRRIKKENFDILYFESLHIWNIAIIAFLKKKVRIYQVIHDVIPHDDDKQAMYVNFMNKIVCCLVDKILIRNRKYSQYIVNKYNVEECNVKYLELCRRYPEFTDPVHNGRFLFFGRINPYKGLEYLSKIVKLCPTIQFDIVGRIESELKDALLSLKRLENVTITEGYVSDEEMRNSFINCDWVILPYNSASQSGVIVDAYKFSRPVIAFDVGAISEQIDDEKSGYLIKAGDIYAFANKINEVANMKKGLYEQMCRQAYEYGVQKYSAKEAAKRFIDVLQISTEVRGGG